MVSVAAIIVTYNRLENLKQAIIETIKQPFAAIVVVDNASTDGTAEWLHQQNESRLMVISLPKNCGGAGGFQVGMEKALTLPNIDWLLLFDDDAYPAPKMLQTFQNQELGDFDAAAAAVYYPNGEICEMNRPSYVPFWSGKRFWQTFLGIFTAHSREGFHLEKKYYQQKQAQKVDCSSFVGFFVRTEWAKNHALPNGELFIYGDDILYTLRLSQAGGRLFFLPEVQFFHDCSTLQRQKGAYFPLWKAYFTYRNGLIIYRQAAGWWFYPVACLKIFSWLLAGRFYKTKWPFFKLWWLAVKDGLQEDTSRNPQEIIELFSDKSS